MFLGFQIKIELNVLFSDSFNFLIETLNIKLYSLQMRLSVKTKQIFFKNLISFHVHYFGNCHIVFYIREEECS
jgi:hypothetical protein